MNPATINPRKETRLTEQQERFVVALVSGMTRREAVRHAGYEVTTDDSTDNAASRLMSNAKVYARYVELRAEVAAEAVMDGARWVGYLKLVAIEAISERDWTGAVAALREIGKHLGLYERDHSQKHVTQADVEAIRAKLKMFGVDFTRKNAPAHLRLNPNGQPPTNGEA